MIKNQWYGILDAKELKANKLISVVRLGEKLAIWKSNNGEINCIFDKCCHRGASLSTGKLKYNTVRCPFHGLVYDATGRVIEIPAYGKNAPVPERFKVNVYQVKEKYGFIWLLYGDYTDEVPEIPFFKYLRKGFSYGSFSEAWPVHYTRAVENQLDVVHLPV